ncbi:MAG: PAS domain-containing protein [Nitrospinae bacterium]|nr:PAS domain-containing protein [Nitrospinota bacterium]
MTAISQGNSIAWESFVRAVLENTEDGIIACDADGNIVFFNRAAREIHDVREESVLAEPWGPLAGRTHAGFKNPVEKGGTPSVSNSAGRSDPARHGTGDRLETGQKTRRPGQRQLVDGRQGERAGGRSLPCTTSPRANWPRKVCRGNGRNNGGSIEVESEPGQGTAFTIILPVKNASLARNSVSSLPAPAD